MTHREAGLLGVAKSVERQRKLREDNISSYNKNPKLCLNCGTAIPYDKRVNSFCCSSCSQKYNNRERFTSIQERYHSSIIHGGDGHRFLCVNCGKILKSLDSHFCSNDCEEIFKAKRLQTGKSISKENAKDVYGSVKTEPTPCPVCGNPVYGSKSQFCCHLCCEKARWAEIKERIVANGKFPASSTTNETDRRTVRKYLEEENGHLCAVCGRREWNDKPIPLIVDHIDGVSTNHSVENFRLICPNCDATSETFKNKHSRKSSRTWRKKYYHPRSGQVPDAQNVDDERGFEVVFS